MTRRFTGLRGVALGAWFVLLWVLLWADISVANLVSGLAVAAVVVLLARRISIPSREGAPRVSPVGTLVFAVHVLWSLVKSNLFLAWEIVTPTNTIETGIVEVPLRSASPVIAMAVSNVVTLTPGSVALGISDVSLTIGVLHLHDPDEIRRSVRRTEQLAIRAFGCPADRRSLDEEAS